MPSEASLIAFVAGATGFTGGALAAQDTSPYGVELRLQVRPGSKSRAALGDDPRVVEVALDDAPALVSAMRGARAVVQLIGTVRARFDEATSYETVDYGTTLSLLAAAKECDVEHFVLLSSVGASTGLGPYLAWKKKTEDAVRESGLGYTVLRPSYLAGDARFTERRAVPNMSAFMNGLSDTPLGSPFALLRPINIQTLARAILACIERGPSNSAVGGNELFKLGAPREGSQEP